MCIWFRNWRVRANSWELIRLLLFSNFATGLEQAIKLGSPVRFPNRSDPGQALAWHRYISKVYQPREARAASLLGIVTEIPHLTVA